MTAEELVEEGEEEYESNEKKTFMEIKKVQNKTNKREKWRV